jgi:hypothetical protein
MAIEQGRPVQEQIVESYLKFNGLLSLGSLTCMQMWELKRTLGKMSNEMPTHNWKLQNHFLGMLQLWDV